MNDSMQIMALAQAAYTVGEWARACSVSESALRAACGVHPLTLRRVAPGSLIVTAEDGLHWLRALPITYFD